MKSILVEVVKGNNKINGRVFTAKKEGEQDRVSYSQDVYFHLGGAFPVLGNISIDSPSHAYPVGQFYLDLSCFTTNEYNQLKMNTYSMELLNEDGSPVSRVPGTMKDPSFRPPQAA